MHLWCIALNHSIRFNKRLSNCALKVNDFNNACHKLSRRKIFVFLQGMVMNGFVNVVISNIEKRYGHSSTESGTMTSLRSYATSPSVSLVDSGVSPATSVLEYWLWE